MKKRTSRLLSALLTLVMVLGLLPALGTTALADERYDLYLEVGENAFDKPEIQSIIYKLTDQHAKRLGAYTVPRHDWSDDLTYYVEALSSDDDIISDEGLAKRPGECLLNIQKIDKTWGQPDKILDRMSVLICVTNARIDRVAVTGIDAPVTGQPLDMTAECSTPGIASVEVIKWHNSTDGVDVVSGAVAQGGKAYSAFVTVTPASGYELVGYSTTKVTVNGGSASPVYGGTDYLTVAYHFPATGGENSENQNWVTTKKIISEVAVTGVVTPVDGAKPVETCELGGTGYTLKSMSWYDGSLKMNSAGTFQAGKTYRACLYLLPEKGYTFDGADSMTATVNGKTVEVTNVYGEPEQRGVTIDFTCEKPSKTISTVDITELDALKPGTAADYTASTSTAGCTVKKVEYQMFQKIMTNYVPADGENIAVVVTVAAADGYEFASGSTATWNGLKSDDTVAGLNANEKRYAFYIKVKADDSQIIKFAAMTVTAPEIGKAPSTAVTGSGVEASDVKWSPADATFQAGTAYTVSFTLKADATHVLADDFKNAGTVTVNGQKATLTSSTKGKFVTYTVSYTFPALKAGEISSVSVTGINAPAIGTKPDTSAEAGSEEYIIASVLWSPGDSKFAADKAYTVNLTLKAAGTNKFTSKVTATVNGQEAKIVSGTGTQELRINYTFPALKAGAPAITTQPKSVSVKEGADVTFSVAATGEALNYQWYQEKGGSAAKVGTNGPTYTIKAVNVSDDNGTVYYCVVSNKAGEVTADKATLTVSKLGTMTAFSDVPEGAYYTDAVAWAVEKGVTSGTSGTTFSPNADCTRAQIVTFLWRAAGSPAPKSKESAFTDVATGSYYETAVQWAVENGITSGTSATTFSPNATCTRAQTVTFLWRSQKSPADGTANSFTDVAEGTYYTDAVKWAVKNGITSGTSATTFSPNADCSRAQIVTFLYRCLGK